MIATTRRMATHDFLLIALSMIVIGVALQPSSPDMQSLQLRQRDGQLQQYCVSVGDPRLDQIRRRLAARPSDPVVPALLHARWRVEAAEFYADRCRAAEAKQSEPLMQVAYTEPQQPTATPTSASQAEYWIGVQNDAAAVAQSIEQQLADHRARVSTPAIVLGEIYPAGIRPRTLVVASLCGLLVAVLMALWVRWVPAAAMQQHDGNEGQQCAMSVVPGEAASGIAMVIPATWIRVHQSWQVRAYSVVYGAIVATAVVAAVAVIGG